MRPSVVATPLRGRVTRDNGEGGLLRRRIDNCGGGLCGREAAECKGKPVERAVAGKGHVKSGDCTGGGVDGVDVALRAAGVTRGRARERGVC